MNALSNSWVDVIIHQNIMDFSGGSDGKMSAYNVGDLGSVPGLGSSPGEGKGYPLHPVVWSGELHGLYSSRGCKESETTE